MTTNYFGEDVAARYDDPDDEMSQAAAVGPVVDFLAALAGDGAALELGIGTGRIALPLAGRGVRVQGIDLSEAMVARLQAKPGAEEIGVAIGDFATTRVEGTLLGHLPRLQHDHEPDHAGRAGRLFRNAAAHLEPGGCFVIEVMLPDLQRLPAGETIRPFAVTSTRLGFDEYDVVGQGLISHHYSVSDGKLRVNAIPFRYVWPAELDLMAQLAGMTLRERWSDWTRQPFTAESTKHISVWEKTGT